MADFKLSEKVPSVSERLMIVVMGWIRASRQDLRTWVGMKSRAQVALEENVIAFRTSASVVGEKNDKDGGGNCGGECGEIMGLPGTIKEEQSLAILSLKKLRKLEASCEGELHVGRQGGILRDRRESRADHNFFG